MTNTSMTTVAPIVALLIAAVGWYYLFYSRASERLEGIEDDRANRLRGRLRRTNAVIMLLMAVGIAYGSIRMERVTMQVLALTWLGVMVLLLIAVILALIDVRLTFKLRQSLRDRAQRKSDAESKDPK